MNKIKALFGSFISMLTLVPALALAQGNIQVVNGFTGFLNSLSTWMKMVVPILIGLAVIAFLWGVLMFVFNASNDEKRKDGKWMMLYGIIGIVVMVSVWGLVAFVQSTFGLNQGINGAQTTVTLPVQTQY